MSDHQMRCRDRAPIDDIFYGLHLPSDQLQHVQCLVYIEVYQVTWPSNGVIYVG